MTEGFMVKCKRCGVRWDADMCPVHTCDTIKIIAGNQWRPIETAPKDGRTILLGYRNSLDKWRTMRGRWIDWDYMEEYFTEVDLDDSMVGWYETSVEADEECACWATTPTHWMPLPTPPEVK